MGELRVPIASNATEGVNRNQRWCAAVDVIVNVYPYLVRTVSGDLNASHDPFGVVCIVDGDVLGAAVIPEGNRAFVPAETAGELRSVTPFHQPVE